MLYQKPNLSQNSAQEINYWQQQLEGIAPLLHFPTVRVREVVSTSQAQFEPIFLTLSENLSQGLKSIAQQQNVALSVILLAAFQVLLYRYTNQENIVVSCLDWFGDRTKKKLEMLPVKVSLDEQQNFSELLAIIQTKISEASNFSNININTITEGLKAKNVEFKQSSWSQMLFRFRSLGTTALVKLSQSEETSLAQSGSFSPTEIFQRELLLDIIETPQNLNCKIEYACHLFDASTIQRLGQNYQVLLNSIVANPQTAIASLSLISTAEQHQVLQQWNQTQTESAPQCLHQLFETQVQQNPEAVAIICQGQELTYGELNAQANQLARYLQTLGVSRQSLVGLCLERSLFMVVGVFAILKAGGAYVPLDITNPNARLAFILEDAQVKVLLTQESLQAKLPAQIEQTVCVDRDWLLISQQSRANLDQTSDLLDLAHIVYTSGSTGKPKGVMLTHGNLSHYAQSLQLALNIAPADTYLHRGSIALIVSARQLLMPLAQGATAVIVTAEETRNPLELFELIKRHGVTIVDHVPSFWRNFWGILNQQSSDRRKSLLDNQVRLVAAGGEQVTPEIYQCWRETFKSHVQLANIYGQTEGTGVVTVYQIPGEIDRRFKSLPVGRPIPNMRVYLLDKNLQPVPIGVAAEIHISGAGVAQGYLNRPELTAEKFVPNPYVEGERLYKTGDLGRYVSDGSIQFLGRVDRQVNIQGLRIELGEIEAVLSQHELVQEAAVVVRENRLGETLVAYVVPSPVKKPTVEMLRGYLQQTLPSYMIPASLTFLDTFPLTTSSKVDRRALSALSVEESSTPIIAARDRLESEIVQMIETILGIERISIRDNFIELGGNSLLAARLVTEIENRYSQNISLSRVFQAPTPEALANLIRQPGQSSYPKSFVPIKLGNSEPTIFCIHYLGSGLEYYRPLVEHLGADISLYGLSVELSNEPDVPHSRDIMGLASYYVGDLQQFQPQGPYYLLGVSFGGVVAYEIARLLVSFGNEVKFLGLIDSHCPDGNLTYRIPSVRERISYHISNLKDRGMAHVVDKIKWRFQNTRDKFQSYLYSFNWVQENLVDQTKQEFAKAKYYQLKSEHEAVNKNYVMQPYSGSIDLFRATKDSDLKLEWQELATAGLMIHDIPGDHLEILEEPYVKILAKKMQLALLKSQKEST